MPLAPTNFQKIAGTQNSDTLQISGCPSDIDMTYFETFFLPQLVMKYPNDGFNQMVGRVELVDQPNSILESKVLKIKFKNEFAKGKAMLKLKDCLYY